MKIRLTESQLRQLIENIIKEEDKGFSTKLTSIDPTTGERSWDIEYKTNLNTTYKDIDDIVNKIEKLVVKNRNDLEAKELLKISKLLRNKFSRYILK